MFLVIIIYALSIGINVSIWIFEISRLKILTAIIDILATIGISLIAGAGTINTAAAFLASLIVSVVLLYVITVPDLDMLAAKMKRN